MNDCRPPPRSGATLPQTDGRPAHTDSTPPLAPLAAQVKEIHAAARMQLPSIALERHSSDDDDDDEPPILTARYGRPEPLQR